MTSETLSSLGPDISTVLRCGSCILPCGVAEFAVGGDPADCTGPQSYTQAEQWPSRTGMRLFSEDGLLCPTYQSRPDGFVNYDLK